MTKRANISSYHRKKRSVMAGIRHGAGISGLMTLYPVQPQCTTMVLNDFIEYS